MILVKNCVNITFAPILKMIVERHEKCVKLVNYRRENKVEQTCSISILASYPWPETLINGFRVLTKLGHFYFRFQVTQICPFLFKMITKNYSTAKQVEAGN